MSDELHECMGSDEVSLRLIGIIERLLDENKGLSGRWYPFITHTGSPIIYKDHTWKWPENIVTCDATDSTEEVCS